MIKREDLSMRSNAELVEQVVACSLEQFDVLRNDDVKTYNKLYHTIQGMFAVLRDRGIEARRVLLPLLQHQNAQVQLNVASELRDIEPARARAAYEYVAKWGPLEQAGPAGMTLDWLDKNPDDG